MTEPMGPMTGVEVEVVSAVIVRYDRILLTQRPIEKDFGFTWETPGGKVDAGETHDEAIVRELNEELGCTLTAELVSPKPFWQGVFENVVRRPDRARVLISFYLVRYDPFAMRRMVLREDQGLGWFTSAELERLAPVGGVSMLSPANTRALTAVIAAAFPKRECNA